MLRYYQYLFYRIYSYFIRKVKFVMPVEAETAIVLISFLELFNILVLLKILREEKMSVFVFFLILILLHILNYILFIKNNKHWVIEKKFENEKPGTKKIIKGWIIVSYIILSIYFFFFYYSY